MKNSHKAATWKRTGWEGKNGMGVEIKNCLLNSRLLCNEDDPWTYIYIQGVRVYQQSETTKAKDSSTQRARIKTEIQHDTIVSE